MLLTGTVSYSRAILHEMSESPPFEWPAGQTSAPHSGSADRPEPGVFPASSAALGAGE